MTTGMAADRIRIEATAEAMGELAAADVAREIKRVLEERDVVRMVFAAAPSQANLLSSLAADTTIEWGRVWAFHMDEYIGLPKDAPQRFGNWLRRTFFDRVGLGKVSLIEPGDDPEECAETYARELEQRPIDIVCLGIGINGHLAFNDPPADFNDPLDVKVVRLEQESRQQQVDEGLFPSIEVVPTHAVSLTIPRLLRATRLFCCVPGTPKERAVTRALSGTVDPESPASILQTHPGCTIYLDEQSAAGLHLRRLTGGA
jgi:glucosamine-6-phosphate deaminase